MTQSGSIRSMPALRGFYFRRRESGVSDRHSCALTPSRSFNFGVEFLRKRLDDASSEPSFGLGKNVLRLTNSIVSNRKLPIRSIDFIRDDDLAFHVLAGECVLQSVQDKFGSDQANTLGLTRTKTAARSHHLHCDRPTISNHRGREGVTQPCEIRNHFNRPYHPRCIELLLNGRDRNDSIMSILQKQARFLGTNRACFRQNNACNNLQAVRNAVLNLVEQHSLLSQ